MSQWQPSASLPVIQQRAMMYQRIRRFFADRQVLELDVPVLSAYATVDPFIDSVAAQVMGCDTYLQTSPEFFMKRFLAAYPQDIYYLGKAFRQDENGSRHRPEFTMLEWYRVGWDEQRLMEEVLQLIQSCCPGIEAQATSYQALFQQHLSLNPHTATVAELSACAKAHIDTGFTCDDKNPWLDLLFTHCIEPKLAKGLVSIYDYPASQAALAQVTENEEGLLVAKRFEVYCNGMELANGYCELIDGDEQERRFSADTQYRQAQGLTDYPYDQTLVAALKSGQFPDCAGVALGVDRLLMCILGKANINEVMSF